MKVSEVRPCDECGGPIAPMFYVIRVSAAMFDAHATDAMLGFTRMLRGSLPLAEIMGANPDVVTVFGDKEPELMTELFLCHACTLDPANNGKYTALMALLEKVNERTTAKVGTG